MQSGDCTEDLHAVGAQVKKKEKKKAKHRDELMHSQTDTVYFF